MTQRTDTGLYFDAEARVMRKRDRELIPRRLVIAMFSMAIAAVMLTGFAVLTERPLVGQPQLAPVVAERSLVIDADGNGIRVTDASTGGTVLDLTNGGFISVVNDGLERARIVNRISGNPPVTLTLYENSRLSLLDPTTGWSTEISSFGPGNVGVWMNLLQEQKTGN
ncbi:MAG: photosynthetic complex assembly protein PuhC [Silicimonas sp.]